MIKAVIFDMDGVIIDSEPLWQEAQIECLAQLGITITRYECEKLTMGKRIDEIAALWCEKYALSIPSIEMQNNILTTLCKKITETGEPINGVLDALRYFSGQNLSIAIATSSNHIVIKAVFDRLKLWDKFSVICSAEDEQYGKPHPDVYLSAAKKLELKPTECLVIEDSLTGLTAAKRANMITYLVNPDCHNQKFISANARFTNLNSAIAFFSDNY